MRYEAGRLVYSPSDLVNFLDGDFSSWMDRWYIENSVGNSQVANESGLPIGIDLPGIVCKPDEEDSESQLIATKGIEHEQAFLRKLQEEGNDVEIIDNDAEDRGVVQTKEAMQRGAPYIYQGRLEHDIFGGFADFLVRRDGDSELGDYFYEVWDTKLARSLKAYFIVQLCCYSEMIVSVQKRLPESFAAVLGDGEVVQRPVQNYLYYFRSLRRRFLDFQSEFSPEKFPHPGHSGNHGRWSTFAGEYLSATEHLSQVANITRNQINRLEAVGIASLPDLAATSETYVPRIAQPVFERLKVQARLQLKSRDQERPRFEVRQPSTENPRLGFALLPPTSPNDVFFDIEGYPFAEGGLEYLLGVVCIDQGEPRFSDWWAHDEQEERQSFQRFIDWLYARWKADPSMHVYHYAPYEKTALGQLAGKHSTRAEEVDTLLRHQVFVDLYKVVRQGLVVGTPSYSLKDIESLYMDARKGEVVTAGGSVVAYHEWIESGESGDWRESDLLRAIRDYNEEDCVSTWKLAVWLRGVQADHGIEFIPPPPPNEKPAKEADIQSTQLANELFQQVHDGLISDAEKKRMQLLLASLLGYHWREAKPVFWRKFDRQKMSEQELIDDFDCLGGLERTATAPRKVKQSHAYEYKYDPDQDTKLHEGSSCFFAHDVTLSTSIISLDAERGVIEIKVGPTQPKPPQRVSLTPDEYVSADGIAQAVYRYVEAWSRGVILSQAVADLLQRCPPRLMGHSAGPIVAEGAELLPATVEAVQRMDKTVMCIQGPPGSGKTFTAAAAILRLLQDGKRVGVTANSHPAILNVLRSVHKAVVDAGQHFRIVKVGSDKDDPLIQSGAIEYAPDGQRGADSIGQGPVVMGGTAWLFSRPEVQGQFDYLFVDEAGQFSLANAVGVGLSTSNLVLVGDQMQLAQPVLGTHPGESGQSALNYLLDGYQTIPPHMGIFLGQTWRLHPAICGFISDAVYEGRLKSHPRTAAQRIETNGEMISKQAGILFIPIAHDGNSQGSEEEVATVEQVVNDLVGCQFWDSDTSTLRRLNRDDILIVAPFNMQVRMLKKRLGHDIQIGSVDKFQGQEAQVVIVSMCSSTLEDSPRGADFLFEPNRLNVAISRAKTLAIVVGSPELVAARCKSIREMELANLFCWLVDYSRGKA